MTSKIPPNLRPLAQPVGSFTLHPRNPRRGDVDAIAATTRLILAGNHMFMAATQLGWDEIAAVEMDVDDDELVCGAATDRGALEALMQGEKAALMWTDPPYGVEYEGKTDEKLRIHPDQALPNQIYPVSRSAASKVPLLIRESDGKEFLDG